MFFAKNAVLKGVIEWVFYIFIALFPFILYRGFLYNGTATRSVNLMVVIELLAILCSFALLQKRQTLSIARSPITLALLCYLGILWVSAFVGVDYSVSFWSKATRTTGLFYFTHLGVFYLLLFQLFSDEKKLRSFLNVFAVSTAVFSALSLAGPDGFGTIFANKAWDGFTFGNSTFAAMYILAGFLVSIYLLATSERRRWSMYLVPISSLINPYFINQDVWRGTVHILRDPLLIVGESRASTYALGASVVLLTVMWLVWRIKSARARRRILWVLTAGGVVLSVLATHSLLTDGGTLREIYLRQSSGARPIVWQLADKAIAQRPAFGWGVDNFDRAFQAHYDNRLLEAKNGNEPWFDRAHNIFIDQAVDTGYVGSVAYGAVYLVIVGSLLYVLLRSVKRSDQIAAAVVLTYFIVHLMELQTAFDTSISYVPLAIMAAFGAVLFHKTYAANAAKTTYQVQKWLQYTIGIALIAYFGWALFGGTIPIARAEIANGDIRTVGFAQRRLAKYGALFGSPLDLPSFLWRTSTDFQRGIAQNPSVLQDPKKVKLFVEELDTFARTYEAYLQKHPSDYRSHLNLADIYMYERLFNIDRLNEANRVLDRAIALVPDAPQAYWMKAVAYLYQRKFDLAKAWANKALAINPSIEESRRLSNYIDTSIKNFPTIDLYFFKSI